MRPARLLRYSILPLLLTTLGSAQSRIWTVDDDAPADFWDIQSAIDASSDGDAILVRPGDYFAFTLNARGVTIVGTAGATFVEGIIQVKNLAAGQVAVLSSLSVDPGAYPPLGLRLHATANLGSLRVQSCIFEGTQPHWSSGAGTTLGTTAAELNGCADLVLVGCEFEGGRGYWDEICDYGCWWVSHDGEPGAVIADSTIALYDCVLRGGQGDWEPKLDFGGTDGGAGAIVLLSFLQLSGTWIEGGMGGPAYTPGTFGLGGDGGPGMDLLNQASTLQLLGSAVVGGAAGEGEWGYGNEGPDFFRHGSSQIVNLAGAKRRMRVHAYHQLEGTTVLATFKGQPGDQVFLPVDWGTDFTFDAGVKGTWVLPQPPTIPPTPIAVIPASGQIQVPLPSNGPTGGNGGEVEFRQMYVVSATGDTILGSPAGVLQIACAQPTSYCTGAPNSVGSGATISLTGTISLAAGDAVLHAAGVPPSQFGLFYYGPNQVQLPWGDGFRCAGGGVYRLGTVLSDGSGNSTDPLDYTKPPMDAGAGKIVAGGSWNFQYWYRDPSGPGGTGFNASDALAVTFCP